MGNYTIKSSMKKWEIRDYGNGVFEIVIALWINTIKRHYLEALAELGKEHYILSVGQLGNFQKHFVITTMPKP